LKSHYNIQLNYVLLFLNVQDQRSCVATFCVIAYVKRYPGNFIGQLVLYYIVYNLVNHHVYHTIVYHPCPQTDTWKIVEADYNLAIVTS